ncbi:MAG TPA: hypothetical protein VF691_15350 [Cytophagaceae bacterium]
MSEIYQNGITLLKGRVNHVIKKAVDTANKRYAPPLDYLRLVKDEVNRSMSGLKASLPSILVTTGITQKLDYDLEFNFMFDVKQGKPTGVGNNGACYFFSAPDGGIFTVIYSIAIKNIPLKEDPLDRLVKTSMASYHRELPVLRANRRNPNAFKSQFELQQAQETSVFGEGLKFVDKHFNGLTGTYGLSEDLYNRTPDQLKKKYAEKLAKLVNPKTAQAVSKTKNLISSTGKVVSKLGPVGMGLSGGVIVYELGSDTWNAHTFVNGAILIGTGIATVYTAPALLTGFAIYGVCDYFFDISGVIDHNFGRKWNKSGVNLQQ